MSRSSVFSTSARTMPTVTFSVGTRSLQEAVLVDSGADVRLMDSDLAKKLAVSTFHLPSAMEATALDGHQLWKVRSGPDLSP